MFVTLLLLVFLIAPLSLFIHELGHVVPALLFRSEQCMVRIGSGHSIFKTRIGRIDMDIRLFFFHGAHSINEKIDGFNRFEKAWISLGGPLMNALVAIILFVSPWFPTGQVMTLFCLFNGYLALVNSVPFHFRGRKSDGYRFLQCLKTGKF